MSQEHKIENHLIYVDRILHYITRIVRLNKLQILILGVFPLIILLGQIISTVSPDELIHNYYTLRGNIINTLFVKLGWFWTFVSYLNLIMHQKNTKKIIRSAKRFIIVTICWFFFSQWFFGLPIMDKIFVLTGGSCSNISGDKIKKNTKNIFYELDNKLFGSINISSKQCRIMKGSWDGGHDPSGHVFLLSLAGCVLLFELFEFYEFHDLVTLWNICIKDFKENLKNKNYFGCLRSVVNNPSFILLIVVITWLWMLLMTSIKYHSILEKVLGLLFSYASIMLAIYT